MEANLASGSPSRTCQLLHLADSDSEQPTWSSHQACLVKIWEQVVRHLNNKEISQSGLYGSTQSKIENILLSVARVAF